MTTVFTTWIRCVLLAKIILIQLQSLNSCFFLAHAETEHDDIQTSADGSFPESNNPLMTPKPVRALISGEKGDSSVVKYKITATPGYVLVISTHFK